MALSNEPLVSLAHGQMRFRWPDYARGNCLNTMTLPTEEFLRRFIPAGFVRIRHFGVLANRPRTAKLARCRALLGQAPPPPPGPTRGGGRPDAAGTGVDLTPSPVCRRGRLRVVAVFGPGARPVAVLDPS